MGRSDGSCTWFTLLGVCSLLGCGAAPDDDTIAELEAPEWGGPEAAQSEDVGTTEQEIVNGTVFTGDLSYSGVVALLYVDQAGQKWICSGTLVTNRHVVTAKHCVNHAFKVSVWMGIQHSFVSRTEVHPTEDLALIHLSKAMAMPVNGALSNTTYAREFDLRSPAELEGKTLMCMGYGGYNQAGDGAGILRKASLVAGVWRWWGGSFSPDRLFYFPRANPTGATVSPGDSGGPCLSGTNSATSPLVTENFASVSFPPDHAGVGLTMGAYWLWIYIAAAP